jgi:hypothetical protein
MINARGLRAAAFAAAINLAAGPANASTAVAAWPMDETFDTTMADSSGNDNDGATYDVVTSGAGYIFNGKSSKIVVPHNSTLSPGGGDFSFTVQVQTNRVPPSGSDYDLLRKGLSSTSGGEYKLEIINSNGVGKAYCLVKDKTGRSAEVTGTTNVADGELHTLTCTKTSSYVSLKVDDLAARKKSASLGSITNTRELVIGARASSGTGTSNDWYNGTMRSAGVSVG